MAFYEIASNLVNYLTARQHEDKISSVRNVNNRSGAFGSPRSPEYIADSYIGRFWTFTASSLIYVLMQQKRKRKATYCREAKSFTSKRLMD
ncbi:unnamed protein product [Brassica rapa subsp. trilocularis]